MLPVSVSLQHAVGTGGANRTSDVNACLSTPSSQLHKAPQAAASGKKKKSVNASDTDMQSIITRQQPRVSFCNLANCSN